MRGYRYYTISLHICADWYDRCALLRTKLILFLFLKEVNEQQESNSTSSNDEEMGRKRNVTPHTNLQKPRPKKKIISAAEKRELRRKKLIERSKSKRLKVKALVHHVPTDEDIADLLKEFTVDFLLKGMYYSITSF